MQSKQNGGIRMAGWGIGGSYHGGWKTLFRPSLAAFQKFSQFLWVIGGDTGILEGLPGSGQSADPAGLLTYFSSIAVCLREGSPACRARARNGCTS